MNQDEARLAIGITAHQKFKVDAGGRRGGKRREGVIPRNLRAYLISEKRPAVAPQADVDVKNGHHIVDETTEEQRDQGACVYDISMSTEGVIADDARRARC